MSKKTIEAPRGFNVVDNVRVKCGECGESNDGKPMFWREKENTSRHSAKIVTTEIKCAKCAWRKT